MALDRVVDVNIKGQNGGLVDAAASLADGTANPTVGGNAAMSHRFNGTTWDRERGNVETGSLITVTTSAVNGADQTNHNAKGIIIVIDITAITGTNITFTLQGKDPTSGKYYTVLASAALTGTGTTVLRVYPGLTASANVTVNDVLPRTFRVITAVTALSAITATCAGILIP